MIEYLLWYDANILAVAADHRFKIQ